MIDWIDLNVDVYNPAPGTGCYFCTYGYFIFLEIMCLLIYCFTSWVMCLWLNCWYHYFLSGVYIYFSIWYLSCLGINIDIISGESVSVLSGGNDLHGLGWLLPSTCSPGFEWIIGLCLLSLFPLHECYLICTIYSSSTCSKCKRGWCFIVVQISFSSYFVSL